MTKTAQVLFAAAAILSAAAAAAPAVGFTGASGDRQTLGKDDVYVAFEAKVPVCTADSVKMTLRDASGRMLRTQSVPLRVGRNALSLHVEDLPAGEYSVLFEAYRRTSRTALATNYFTKTSAAAAERKGSFVTAEDGSRAQLAPGNPRAKDLTPLTAFSAPRGEPVVVVADGVARMPIVAAEARGEAVWLAEIIEKMTGAKPPVLHLGTNTAYTGGGAIYIGDTLAAREAGVTRPGTPDTRWGVGAHAFRCLTKGGDVFLIGAHATASGYAVYDFAERILGVRQYYPDRKIGELVIKTEGLALPRFNWSDKPVYEFRTEFAAGHRGWKFGDAHQSSHRVHTPSYWHVDPNLGYKPSRWTGRPEIFALSENGERARTAMLCYGNPRTLQTYKEHINLTVEGKRRGFMGDPVDVQRKTVTVSQYDAAVVCHCDFCKKLVDKSAAPTGDASPIIWGYFTKELAKWMKRKYPDWRISILPYINTCDVPKGLDLTAEGNVDAFLCTMPGLALLAQESARRHEEELMRQWAKATGNPVQNWHYICWPADRTCAPYVFGGTAVEFYRRMKGVICGSFLNGGYPVDRLGLSAYVWVRAMWNPGFEAKDVYDEFASRMFGKAAAPMRKLIDMQEKGWARQWKRPSVTSKNVFGISYPRAEVEEMERIIKESFRALADDAAASNRLAYYAKPFERFFRESWEYANNKAFPDLHMRKAAELPKIDGDLSDPCWKLAEPLSCALAGIDGSGSRTNTVAKYPTYVQAVWTSQGVVFGITCMEKTPDRLQTSHPAGDWWGNDCLEIFVDPTGELEGVYFKLWIDAVNQLRVQTKKWEPKGLKSGAKINKDSWSVEIYIPYSDLGFFADAKIPTTQGGIHWNGNIARLRIADAWLKDKSKRTPGSVWELSRLYNRFGNFNSDLNAFGVLKFVEQ
ncbi:MAG: DUF4838 domain-containing protein [Kiritimatiellae bacterium]|nr:DUF4838 domain-containing protein [Kiritimatiellia bacterium]